MPSVALLCPQSHSCPVSAPACLSALQRDHLGLLATSGNHGIFGQLVEVEDLLQEEEERRQAQQQQHTQQQQQQQQQGGAGATGAGAACSRSSNVPNEQHQEQQKQQRREDRGQALLDQLGRSPDSDDGGEQTGRHLLRAFHSRGEARAAAADCDAPLQEAPDAQEQGQAVAEPPLQQAGGEQRHSKAGVAAGAAAAHTPPEHGQAAALLGQPVYDRSLLAPPPGTPPASSPVEIPLASPRRGSPTALLGPPLVVRSSSVPHRSPFMSELLHHAHPPGPQEAAAAAPRRATAEAPAAPEVPLPVALARPGVTGAAAVRPGLGRGLPRLGSAPAGPASEAYWVPEETEAAAAAAALAKLPFSVRNAPLLRVMPKYCECLGWGAGGL